MPIRKNLLDKVNDAPKDIKQSVKKGFGRFKNKLNKIVESQAEAFAKISGLDLDTVKKLKEDFSLSENEVRKEKEILEREIKEIKSEGKNPSDFFEDEGLFEDIDNEFELSQKQVKLSQANDKLAKPNVLQFTAFGRLVASLDNAYTAKYKKISADFDTQVISKIIQKHASELQPLLQGDPKILQAKLESILQGYKNEIKNALQAEIENCKSQILAVKALPKFLNLSIDVSLKEAAEILKLQDKIKTLEGRINNLDGEAKFHAQRIATHPTLHDRVNEAAKSSPASVFQGASAFEPDNKSRSFSPGFEAKKQTVNDQTQTAPKTPDNTAVPVRLARK